MNRKKFLSSVMGMGALLPAFTTEKQKDETASTIPPYLKKGDTIGITSVAGYITLEDIQPAIEQITNWGYKIKIGQTIGKKYFNFGGTDEERAADLQQMLNDNSLQAIMCARGGYGIVRIIDQLDFAQFVKHPKWIIGFSDVTILHCHISKNYRIASIHSKMCNSFPKIWNLADDLQKNTIISIQQALNGTKTKYSIAPYECNINGVAHGELIGGNLKLIESMAGTKSDINTKGKILFVEDTGEYLYSIDRMFMNLKRTGKLSHLKGLIVGGFKIKPDDPGEEFGIVIEDIILSKVKEYNYPVCFNFPVGHQKNNFALKCGIKHRLEITNTSCTLEEIIKS